jgi:hypothetical protein
MNETNEDQNNREINEWVKSELKRIEKIKQEMGTEVWMEAIGSSIVTCLALMMSGVGNPRDRHLLEKGKQVLKALSPQLEELRNSPKLNNGFTAGLINELASRRLIDLDVN